MEMIDNSKNRRHFAAHTAWATFAFVVSILMIFTINKGHPPLIIFLPLVILVWIVGHFAIWGVMWLTVKGRHVVNGVRSGDRAWPVGLWLAVIGTGVFTSLGVFQILVTGYLGRPYPYHYANLWAIMLVIELVHAACFVGLLLRKQWSRHMSGLLAFGWAMLLASQIAEHLPPRAPLNISELMIAIGIMVLLFILGLYFFISRKMKSCLKN